MHRLTGFNSSADDFLGKPVEVNEALVKIRSGMRLRNLQHQLVKLGREAALLEDATQLGHEINNPLSALIGHIELLSQYLNQKDEQRAGYHLHQAGEVGSRIAEITKRLIALREPREVVRLDQRSEVQP